jgi:hypothetical protein
MRFATKPYQSAGDLHFTPQNFYKGTKSSKQNDHRAAPLMRSTYQTCSKKLFIAFTLTFVVIATVLGMSSAGAHRFTLIRPASAILSPRSEIAVIRAVNSNKNHGTGSHVLFGR